MTLPKKQLPLSVCALAVALALAGCGGGNAEPPPLPPPVVVPDTTPPTVAITDSEAGTPAAGTAVTFSFAFSEDVGTSFGAKDITVTGGKAGDFTRVSGTQATLVVTPPAGVASGTLKVEVATGAYSDAAGNANTAAASAEQAFGTAAGTGTVLATFDEATPPAVTEFGGAGYAIEEGPAGGDGKALTVTRDGGETYAGAWVATAPMPFSSTRKTITANVYSPAAGTPMVVKVEYGENTGTAETSPTTAVVKGWQTLTWVFNDLDLSKSYTRFTMLPNLGAVGTGQKYHFDDITVAPAGDVPVEPPAGKATVLATFDEATPPEVTEFGGAGYEIKAGPAGDGGSGNALAITRPGGEVYAGAYVATAPIPFAATRKTITARVYSPAAGTPMVAKAEYAENTGTGDTNPTTAVVEGWQTLTWVFDNVDLTKSYNRFTILPNLGTVGTGQTYYFDDIKLLAAAGEGGALSYIAQPFIENQQSAYNTFTGEARTGNYATGNYFAPGTLQWFGGTFKSAVQVVFGVSKTDTTQSYFGLYIANGGEGWDISAATTYYFNLGTNGECAGKCTANVRLVSMAKPECVADVLVPLSSAAPVPYSRKLTDFKVSGCATNTMAAFKKLKVSELHFQMLRDGMQFSAAGDIRGNFPNGLQMGDSIAFDAPTGAPPTAPDEVITGPAFSSLTFDDPDVTYTATDFEGLSSSIVNAPAGSTGKALKANKVNGAAKWAGTTISTGPNNSIDKIPFTATAKKLTMKVWAPEAGMTIRMKVEDASDVTHNCETDATTTVAKGWQTLTFDFAVVAMNDGNPTSNRCADTAQLLVSTFNKVSVFPSYGVLGAVAGDFYFDDLKFTGN